MTWLQSWINWQDPGIIFLTVLILVMVVLGSVYVIALSAAEAYHFSKERFHDRIMQKYDQQHQPPTRSN